MPPQFFCVADQILVSRLEAWKPGCAQASNFRTAYITETKWKPDGTRLPVGCPQGLPAISLSREYGVVAMFPEPPPPTCRGHDGQTCSTLCMASEALKVRS